MLQRIYGTAFFSRKALDEHLERFARSCEGFRLENPYSFEEMRRICAECVDRAGLSNAYVKMQITRGVPPPGIRDPRARPGHAPAAVEGSAVVGEGGSIRPGLTPAIMPRRVEFRRAIGHARAIRPVAGGNPVGTGSPPGVRRLHVYRPYRRSSGIRSRAGCGRRRPSPAVGGVAAASPFDQPLIRFTVRMMTTVAAPPQRAMLRPPTTPVSPSPTAGMALSAPEPATPLAARATTR